LLRIFAEFGKGRGKRTQTTDLGKERWKRMHTSLTGTAGSSIESVSSSFHSGLVLFFTTRVFNFCETLKNNHDSAHACVKKKRTDNFTGERTLNRGNKIQIAGVAY